jgi:signal transduction histidine kinase
VFGWSWCFFWCYAQLQRVQMRLHRSPQPVFAYADENRLKSAVLNVVPNAVDATRKGGELFPAGS